DDGGVLPELPEWRRAAESSQRYGEARDNDNGGLPLVLSRECDHVLGKGSGDGKRQIFAHRKQIRALLARSQGNQGDKLLDAAVTPLLDQAMQKLLFASRAL